MNTNRRRYVTISLAALILAISACGCVSSKQEARKQAVAHWQQVRTGVTLQMALKQLQGGQPERARESLLDAIRSNPDDPQLHLLLARVQFELRDLSAAQAALARARSLGPTLAGIDYWQGVLAQAAGQWDDAHAAYQAACTKAPDSADYLCAMLEAKLALGRPAEVTDLAPARFRDFPADARLRLLAAGAAAQQGDLSQAEDLYEQATNLDPSDDAARQALAQVLYQAGKYERAAGLLQGLQDQPGTNRKSLRPMLAACHVACRQYEKAQRLYEICLAEDPDQVSLRLRLNEARLLSGQALRALQDLQTLLERQPGHPQGWELLGHACALEGNLPQARVAYARAGQCGGNAQRLQEYIHAIDLRTQVVASAGAGQSLDVHTVTRADNDPAR